MRDIAGTAHHRNSRGEVRVIGQTTSRPPQPAPPTKRVSSSTQRKKSKKSKKSKRQRTPSSSSSSSSSSLSDSSSESDFSPARSQTSREASPDSAKHDTTWDLINAAWDLERRPAELQSREAVKKYSIKELESLYRIFQDAEKNKKGEQLDVSAKDEKQPVTRYEKQKDDGKKRLHPARWSRLPVGKPEKWWPKTPTQHKSTFISMDLSFTGSQHKVADRTLQKLHDRTLAIELKAFCSENASVNSKPQKEERRADGSSVRDLDWVTPTSVSQIQEAVVNYLCTNHSLWPWDMTGFSLLRLLTRYRWFDYVKNTKTQILLVTNFFNAVMRKNKTAAANKTCILSYRQQEELLKEVLAANHLSGDPPLRDHAEKPEGPLAYASNYFPFAGTSYHPGYYTNPGSYQNQNAAKPLPQNKPQAQPQRQPAQRSRNQDQKRIQLCYGFNDTDGKGGCRNPLEGDGCKGKSRNGNTVFYTHRCNVVIDPTNGVRCLQKHPRRDHRY